MGGLIRWLALVFAIGLLLASPASAHSPTTPDYGSVHYWTHRYFGHGWQARRAICISWQESRWELSPPDNGSSYGPWQINLASHPWLDVYRVTHSWRYAARTAKRVAWHPPRDGHPGYYDFSPWHPDCGS